MDGARLSKKSTVDLDFQCTVLLYNSHAPGKHLLDHSAIPMVILVAETPSDFLELNLPQTYFLILGSRVFVPVGLPETNVLYTDVFKIELFYSVY